MRLSSTFGTSTTASGLLNYPAGWTEDSVDDSDLREQQLQLFKRKFKLNFEELGNRDMALTLTGKYVTDGSLRKHG